MYTYCSKWLNLGLQSKNNSRAARAKHKVEISVLGVKMVQLFGARPIRSYFDPKPLDLWNLETGKWNWLFLLAADKVSH